MYLSSNFEEKKQVAEVHIQILLYIWTVPGDLGDKLDWNPIPEFTF